MAVDRFTAVIGEDIDLFLTFREDDTGQLFDPFSVDQIDIFQPGGTTPIETITSGSITRVSLGLYKITMSAVALPGVYQDRWSYKLKDGGQVHMSTEIVNVTNIPTVSATPTETSALPRFSAVTGRPITLVMEFRDDKTGELFDPFEVRQVEILESDGTTVIETITSITRIGLGKFRIVASSVSTARTILDRWYFTVDQGEPERTHTQDTQVNDPSTLGVAAEAIEAVPEILFADVGPTDTEIVLQNSIKKIGVTFRDTNGVLINPAALSLEITDLDGNVALSDIYLPLADRSPNPPRIINPSAGVFQFPLGLDNGLTSTKANPKKNKTEQRCDFLFTWRASSVAGVASSLTLDPTADPDNTIIWTAVSKGTTGDLIQIEYVDPGTPNASLSFTRTGALVQVNLATDGGSTITTTAADVVTAAALNTEVSEIVTTALPTGNTGTGLLAAFSATNLANGVDASQELVVCENVKVISHRVCSTIGRFRLLVDKAVKLVDTSDLDDPCFLGYSEGQLVTYLEDGLQIINSYQPSGCFTLDNFPYGKFEFILLESALLAGVMSQTLFAVDTDIPSWNDQGNSFVIQHQPQLANYLNWLSNRLDRLIPQFKLNFVSAGSLHIEAGPNFRLAALIDAAPSGSLFRNTFFKG